jgi:uncharacterized membrane protein YgcG
LAIPRGAWVEVPIGEFEREAEAILSEAERRAGGGGSRRESRSRSGGSLPGSGSSRGGWRAPCPSRAAPSTDPRR